MKKFIALLAFATGLSVLTTSSAQAGPHHHSSSQSVSRTCGSCGGAVYRQRVVVSYDHCGDPVYAWRTSSHRCAPRHDSGSSGGHDQGGNGHNGRSKGHHHAGH